MKKIEVFDGNELHETPILYPTQNPRCAFIGLDKMGKDIYVPVDANLLSRHMVLLGGIGTGKTNTFNQIITQLRESMTNDDVMIIFDTKGDFYNTFYRPGDIVISNDGTATGPNGKDYWNIFIETGAPEMYLLYSKALKMEATDVLDDPGTGAASHGLQ